MKKDYYIQGDPARAEEIKAAFQELGINVLDFGFADRAVVYCSIGECVQYLPYSINLMNILYSHPAYMELPLPVKPNPKFKIGDWLWHKTKGIFPLMVEDYDEKEGYLMLMQYPESKCYFGRDIIENDYRLWEISDAKEGDVLAVDWNEKNGHVKNKWEKIVIFKSINKVGVEGYGCTFRNNKLAFVDTDVPYYSTTWTRTLKPASKKQRDLLFKKMKEAGYQWDADKKELRKIIKPKFNVGDWITNDYCAGKVIALTDDAYLLDSGQGIPFSCEHNAHLWTIKDARNGDILMCEFSGWIGVFNELNVDKFSSHCFANLFTGDFYPNGGKSHNSNCPLSGKVTPATKKQCNLFFAKMREAGYEWDEKKKKLKKIPKHYDISSFYEGMPVLVRDDNDEEWNYLLFSHYRKKMPDHFFAGGNPWHECIPFNEETKHLLGTTDMCDEQYVNW